MNNPKLLKFKPVNKLEKLLEKAARKPKQRGKFHAELLEADVYVIPLNKPAIWNDVAVKGQKLQLLGYSAHGVFFIAFYSSPERAEVAMSEGLGVLKLSARDFFKVTKGSYLVLNPHSGLGKEFVPSEINDILQQDYEESPKLD